MSPTPNEAAESLAAMRDTQARLAAAAHCPPERHFIFAAMMGCIVATPALPPRYAIAVELLLIIGVLFVVRWDRRRTGMFVNGYRSGRTRPIAFGMVAIFLLFYALGTWLAHSKHILWAPVALGMIAAVIGYQASALWQRVFMREMGVAA